MSFLLNHTRGYRIGKPGERNLELTHNFFVDDLKLYSENQNEAKVQLDVVTKFSKDIGMSFGEEKCARVALQRGQRKSLGKTTEINNIKVRELNTEESYRYLGIDESIGFNDQLNKETVSKEYFRRVKKIWKSELSSRNKIIAHNCFAVALFRPTVGILNWTKEEIGRIDIESRKILTMTGTFHPKSDVDRLYTSRKDGGREILSISDVYCCRIIRLQEHLEIMKVTNTFLLKVYSMRSKV